MNRTEFLVIGAGPYGLATALGFQQTSTPDFILELRRIAATEDVLSVEETEFGRKYTVVGQLKGPSRRAPEELVAAPFVDALHMR